MYRGVFSRAAIAACLVAAVGASASRSHADTLSDIGVTLLRSPGVQPVLTGANVTVAIVEGTESETDPNVFEVDPVAAGITSPMTWVNNTGSTATSFPNIVGSRSNHATAVGQAFTTVAPTLTRVYSFEAEYFVNHVVVQDDFGADAELRVINQSFAVTETSQYYIYNQVYDNYVNAQNKIVVSAAGNGPNFNPPMAMVQAPATAYNVISVGALGINPGSTGTPEGRTKIDITAPGSATSFTTPLVSGVATLLVHAGTLGLGGSTDATKAAAMDARTIKSILQTGATKTADWSHSSSSPLDAQVGAGIVNAYGSYRILSAGRFTPSSVGTLTNGGSHAAETTGTAVGTMGWSLQNGSSTTSSSTISSTLSTSGLHHYVLDVPATGLNYVLTATLNWNRVTDSTPFDAPYAKWNNLDLFLYSGATQITASTSTVDNLEHLYYPTLTPGIYDLQVLKRGGSITFSSDVASNSETYALSWAVTLLGDTNWDGFVDIVDLTTVTSRWMTEQRGIFNGDLTGDGWVDQLDFDIVAANWQSGVVSGGPLSIPTLHSLMAVPEPAALGVVGIGVVAMMVRRRRR